MPISKRSRGISDTNRTTQHPLNSRQFVSGKTSGRARHSVRTFMAKQNKAAGRDGPAILVVGLKLILAAARCALDDSLSFLNCLISEQHCIGIRTVWTFRQLLLTFRQLPERPKELPETFRQLPERQSQLTKWRKQLMEFILLLISMACTLIFQPISKIACFNWSKRTGLVRCRTKPASRPLLMSSSMP